MTLSEEVKDLTEKTYDTVLKDSENVLQKQGWSQNPGWGGEWRHKKYPKHELEIRNSEVVHSHKGKKVGTVSHKGLPTYVSNAKNFKG